MLVSGWFEKGRGTGRFGITLVGTSLGGTIIPLIAQPLIANYGWRTAMLALSGVVWFVLLPLVILPIREKSNAQAEQTSDVVDGMSLAAALRTRVFWALAACSALVSIRSRNEPAVCALPPTTRIGVSAETASLSRNRRCSLSASAVNLSPELSDRSVRGV